MLEDDVLVRGHVHARFKLVVTGTRTVSSTATVEVAGQPGTCFKWHRGADLANCELADRDLSGRNLTGANLTGADLSAANLADANLTDATLSDANLSGTNLAGAVWSNTICPNGTNSDYDGSTCANNRGGPPTILPGSQWTLSLEGNPLTGTTQTEVETFAANGTWTDTDGDYGTYTDSNGNFTQTETYFFGFTFTATWVPP